MDGGQRPWRGLFAHRLTRRQAVGTAGLLTAIAGARPTWTRISAAQPATVAPTTTPSGYQGQPAVVGTPSAQATGPAVTEVGPAPGQATPVAGVDFTRFMAISAALVGGGQLDEQRGQQLLDLIVADAPRRAALRELVASSGGTSSLATPVADLSTPARDLARQVLQFWYLGTYDGQPVTARGDVWFSLSAWQAVRYTPAPSVCKAFGFWTQLPRPG